MPSSDSFSSLSSSFTNPTSSPILIDTLVLFLIQTGYYLLSRRFLLHALPTLRQISKRVPEGGGHGILARGQMAGGNEDDEEEDAVKETGILGLPTLARAGEDGQDEDDQDGGMINASGGLSDDEHQTHSSGRYRGIPTMEEMDESDTDSVVSYAAGSPNPSARPSLDGYPLLPLHSTQPPSTNLFLHPSTTHSSPQIRSNSFQPTDPFNPNTHAHAHPHTTSAQPKSPNISIPGKQLPLPNLASTSNPTSTSSYAPGPGQDRGRRTTEPRRKRVLRLIHGRNRGAGAGGMIVGDGERVRTTRGLGWLARNLFSLCFSECLLLLTLVMFHSIGILHSRSRRVHFSFSLHVLLLLILFIVPLVQCLQLTYRSREPAHASPNPSSTNKSSSRRLTISKRLLISLIPFGIYIFMFTRIPPYITTQTSTPVLALEDALNSTLVAGNITGNGVDMTTTTLGTGSKGSKHRIALPAHVHLGDYAELDEAERVEGGEDGEGQELGDDDEEEEDDGVQEDWQHGGWLEPGLGRVVVCGIIIMGALSGFGAVRTAWGFYENGGLKSGRVVSREDIIAAERSLYRVRHDIMFKRDTLSRQDQLGGDPSAASGTGKPSMIRSASGWLDIFGSSGTARSTEGNAIRRELVGLEMMEGQVKRSLEAMKLRRKRQRFAQTLRGKVYNLVGVIFAFYCVARVLMCLTSIIFPPLATSHLNQPKSHSSDTTLPRSDGKGNTNGDWISYSIALTLSQLPTGVVDVQMWSRAISLLLTGLLILASLAQVLRSVARILRLTSKSIGAGFLLLGLSQLMSTYVISLLIQMRSYIPPSTPVGSDLYSPIGSNTTDAALQPFAVVAAVHKDPSLLATLPDFRVFGRLFDVMFVLAAVGTAVWRYIGHKLNGPDEFGTVYH